MREERVRVLRMMDQGKISLEEANELLITMEINDYKYVESKNRERKK